MPLIILDLNLPKLGGRLGVLKIIREDERMQQLAVLILTSSKEDEDLISSYSLGVTRYVRKTVDFADFVGAVKSLGTHWLMIDESPRRGSRREPGDRSPG